MGFCYLKFNAWQDTGIFIAETQSRTCFVLTRYVVKRKGEPKLPQGFVAAPRAELKLYAEGEFKLTLRDRKRHAGNVAF